MQPAEIREFAKAARGLGLRLHSHLSEIGEFRRSSFDVTHRMTLTGELAVEGRETRVWAGRGADGRIRGKPIPDEVIGRFRVA